jgi:hypothetical protein
VSVYLFKLDVLTSEIPDLYFVFAENEDEAKRKAEKWSNRYEGRNDLRFEGELSKSLSKTRSSEGDVFCSWEIKMEADSKE